MAEKWSTILLDPRYEALSSEDKQDVQDSYWSNVVTADPQYHALPPEDQQQLRARFEASTRDEPDLDAPPPTARVDVPSQRSITSPHVTVPSRQQIAAAVPVEPRIDPDFTSRMDYLRRVYITERRGSNPQGDKYFNDLPTAHKRQFLREFSPEFASLPAIQQDKFISLFDKQWAAHVENLRQAKREGRPTIGAARPPPEFEKERGLIGEYYSSLAAGPPLVIQNIQTSIRGLGELIAPRFMNVGKPYDRQREFGKAHWTEPRYWGQLRETEPLRPRGIRRLDHMRPLSEKMFELSYLMRRAGEFAPQIGGAIAATLVAGPIGGMAFMTSQEGAEAYDRAIAHGASKQRAGAEMLGVGIVAGALEYLPVARVMARIGRPAVAAAKRTAVAQITRILLEGLKTGAIETSTEGAQAIVANLGAELGHGEDVSLKQYIEGLGEPMYLGALFGILFGAGGEIASRGQQRAGIRRAAVRFGLGKDAPVKLVQKRMAQELREMAVLLGLDENASVEEINARVVEDRRETALTLGLTESASIKDIENRVSELQDEQRAEVATLLGLEADASVEEIEQHITGVMGVGETAVTDALQAQEEAQEEAQEVAPPEAPPAEEGAPAIAPVPQPTEAVIPPMRHRALPRTKKEINAVFKWYKGEPVAITPSRLLQYGLKHEAKGARVGYRVGQIEHGATQAQMLTFAEAALPPSEYNLVVRALKRITKARTPAEFEAVRRSINLMVENYERASAVQEYLNAQKRIKKLKRSDRDHRHPLRPEFQKALDTLTADFTVTVPRKTTQARFESVLKAAELDEIGEIPQRLIDQAKRVLANADKPSLRKMDPDDIRAIARAVQSIAKQNQHKNQLIGTARYRAVDAAVEETAATIAELHGETVTKVTRRSKLVHTATGANLSHDTRIARLVGETGAGQEILHRNLQTATGEAIALNMDAQAVVVDSLKTNNVTASDLRRQSESARGKPVPDSDLVKVELPGATLIDGTVITSVDMTVAERMELLSFLRDPANRAALLRNKQEGFTLKSNPLQEPIKVNAQTIAAIRDSATPEEGAISRDMMGYTNGPLRDAVNQTSMGTLGFEIWLRTEHWPRLRDPSFIKKEPSALIQQSFEVQLLESFDIFKERVEYANTPFLIGDIYAHYRSHVAKAAAYAAKTPAVHDALRLLADRRFTQQVRRSIPHGDDVLGDLNDSVRSYIGTDVVAVTDVSALAKGFIRRAHVGLLALKPAIIAYQKISLFNAIVEIEAKYIARALIPAPTQTQAEIDAYSSTLAARLSTPGYQIFTPGSEGASLLEFYFPKKKSLSSLLMLPITASDAGVIHVLWRAARAKMIDQGFTGDDLMRETAKLTEIIVERTQPTWDLLTISQLAEEGKYNAYLKILATMFSSQRNKNFNMVVRGWARWQQSEKTVADFNQLAKSLVIPTLVNATAVHSISFGVSQGFVSAFKALGLLDEDADKRKLWNSDRAWLFHVEGILRRMFGNWLIIGDFVNEGGRVVLRKILDEPGKIGVLHRNLLVQTSEDAVFMFAHLTDAILESPTGRTRASKVQFILFAERAANFASVAAGLPIQGLVAPARSIIQEKKKELTKRRR